MKTEGRPVVFLGPSLALADAAAELDAEFLPPVQLGDVWRLSQERPPAIGIVDGYFDSVPAVWHKEILSALSSGIPVYGASSMGALRAAELGRYGMVGVGDVADAYAAGRLTCDDEVALAHADGEHAYQPFSEPLVNIRATVAAAAAAGVVSARVADAVVAAARSLFYPDRTWDRLLVATPAPAQERASLEAWLATGRVDVKRADALALLRRIRDDLSRPAERARPPSFTPTVPWTEMVRRETPVASILDEFLITDPLPAAVAAAVARAQGGEPVDWFSVLSGEAGWPDHCRRARQKTQRCGARVAADSDVDPVEADEVLGWFFGERLGWPDDIEGFLRDRGWTDPRSVLAVAAREAAFLA